MGYDFFAWSQGDFSYFDLVGLLPGVSNQVAKKVGNGLEAGIDMLRWGKKTETAEDILKGMSNLNPNKIRFSQSFVNGSQEIIESMMKNGWAGDPIDVVRMSDGGLTTIDNTRVVAARAAGIDVEAVVHNADDLLPEHLIERFTTKKGVPTTWGEAIELRIGKQNSNFRNSNLFGSFEMERIK